MKIAYSSLFLCLVFDAVATPKMLLRLHNQHGIEASIIWLLKFSSRHTEHVCTTIYSVLCRQTNVPTILVIQVYTINFTRFKK